MSTEIVGVLIAFAVLAVSFVVHVATTARHAGKLEERLDGSIARQKEDREVAEKRVHEARDEAREEREKLEAKFERSIERGSSADEGRWKHLEGKIDRGNEETRKGLEQLQTTVSAVSNTMVEQNARIRVLERGSGISDPRREAVR